jgi:hypothetical protein
MLFKKGQTPWNKNKIGVYSKIALAKMRKAKIGKPLSKNHREKIGLSLLGNKNTLGYVPSVKTREKLSKSLKKAFSINPIPKEIRRKVGEAQKGEKHHNWKGGLTPKNKQIRESIEMKEWRTMVFGRDSFACQMCFAKGVYLNAHHLKSFSKYPELRFEVSNGITLCQKCHDKTKGKEEEIAPLLQTLVLNQMKVR